MIAYLYLFDGFADWEPALAAAEINTSEPHVIQTVTKDGQEVTSQGGLSIKPHLSLSEIDIDQSNLLLLPGGDMWEGTDPDGLAVIVQQFIDHQKLVAAICGATYYLARLGLLNNVIHTSNGLKYLKQFATGYSGDSFYINQSCVWDAGIITANGTASVDFAFNILKALEIYNERELSDWYKIFKIGIID